MMESSPSTVSATANAIIRTARLAKVYAGADFRAVDELSLTVAVGKIFGLLGPNGAGKTTTAGMLTTLVIPTSGSANVAGVDVIGLGSRDVVSVAVASRRHRVDPVDLVVGRDQRGHDQAAVLLDADHHLTCIVVVAQMFSHQRVQLAHAGERVRDSSPSQHVAFDSKTHTSWWASASPLQQ